jgi:hypothetical protein
MSLRSDLPACVVCQRPCVPLADYDAAVCHRCDAEWEAVLIHARLVDATHTPAEPLPAPAPIPHQLFDDLRREVGNQLERTPA